MAFVVTVPWRQAPSRLHKPSATGLASLVAVMDDFASLVLGNTPSRIPDRIKRAYALDRANSARPFASMGSANGACKRLDTGCTWARGRGAAGLVHEMDRAPASVAPTMHEFF
jgi:hypothetical protein